MTFKVSKKTIRRIGEWTVLTVCWGIILYVAGKGLLYFAWAFLGDQFIIPTQSMVPTLVPGDRVLVDKTIMGARIYKDFDFDPEGMELKCWRTRGRRGIRRNDVVVFNYPEHGGHISFVINHVFCKRVAGLPGDSISVVEGRLHNNNHEGPLGYQPAQDRLAATPDSLVRCYLPAYPLDGHIPWTIRNMGPLYIPRRGDRIRVTAREGTLYRRILEWETGRKIHCDWEKDVVWTGDSLLTHHTFQHNCYFMCGDNVGNSNDSRYWGFVPEEYIVGVVTRIHYSRDRQTDEERRERRWKKVEYDNGGDGQ